MSGSGIRQFDPGPASRFSAGVLATWLMAAPCILAKHANANSDGQAAEPLEFGFITEPTGRKVSLGTHQLHVECRGDGMVTVLFEPGLGGHALEWRPVENLLADRARTCTYDRAGYAWSDRSPYPRQATQLAREADQLLDALKIEGPLILVGHSFGGFIVRQLAALRANQLIGLVLVDASHEDQFDRLESLGDSHVLPRGPNFVLSAIEVPDHLPEGLRRRVAAFARTHKTYAAVHGELAAFRRSADELQEEREVVDYPVRVLRRGLKLYRGRKNSAGKNALWRELQDDLATLSHDGRVIVAAGSGHHVHIERSGLVADVIIELIGPRENKERQ